MCGIASILSISNNSKVEQSYLKNIAKSLNHRGPDGEEIYLDRGSDFGIVHKRLSIVGLENGKQPFVNQSESIFIIVNGEIYNHPSIKKDLDVKYQTESDCESVYQLYLKHGQNFINYVDGMFSIIIFDKNKERIYLARDRFGKKPLYYYKDFNWFICSSELPSIYKSGIDSLTKTCNLKGLNDYFVFGNSIGEETILQEIKKVPASHLLEFDFKGILKSKVKYYSIPAACPKHDYSEIQLHNEFKSKLENSILKRQMSDVPIAVPLSGGIDSTIIAGTCRNLGLTPETFTIGFEEKGFNESEQAKKTAKDLGLKNTTIILEKELTLDKVMDIMNYIGEPFYDSSAIPTFALFELIGKNFKVALTGDAGDETFLGYTHYDEYLRYPAKYINYIPPILSSIWQQIKVKNWDYFYTHKFCRTHYKYINQFKCNNFMSETRQEIKKTLYNYESNDFKDLFSKLDLHLYMKEDILVKIDRMSMRNSVEARCPFLDTEFVDFWSRVPSQFKLGPNNSRKYIMKKYLINEFGNLGSIKNIVNNKKKGFSFPIHLFIKNEKDKISDKLTDKEFIDFFSLNYEAIKEILFDYYNKNAKYGGKSIWILYCLYHWWETIIKRDV